MQHNIADLRAAARRRLPKGLFEFVDRGAEDDAALAANRRVYGELSFRPRVLRDVQDRDRTSTVFGKPISAPIAVAPTGAAGLLWHDGEIAIARAAAKAGIPFTLSTASITAMERVAEEAGGRLWFQLYMWPDRRLSEQLVQRAAAAGYEALLVTVDTVITPKREYNQKNGFSLPFSIGRRNVLDSLRHPRWLLGVLGRYALTRGMPRLENFPDELRRALLAPAAQARSLPKAESLNWDDLRALRRTWAGPLLVKGILHPEDAILAAQCGADGIVVSNHGGRNLDAALTSLAALPDIVDAVGHRLSVTFDGGVQRGSDVAKALALGADLVFTGRAPLWGVAARGEAGASAALDMLVDELDRVLGMLGCRTLAQLDRSLLFRVGDGFAGLDSRATKVGPHDRSRAGDGDGDDGDRASPIAVAGRGNRGAS